MRGSGQILPYDMGSVAGPFHPLKTDVLKEYLVP